MKNRTKAGRMVARLKAARVGRTQPVSPLRQDPTRTVTLRRVFLGKIRKQFAIIKLRVRWLIGTSDFMRMSQQSVIQNALQPAYSFGTSTDRLRSFQYWLKAQLESHIVGQTERQIWEEYVAEGFRKGAGRAFDDTRVKRPKKGKAKSQTPAVSGYTPPSTVLAPPSKLSTILPPASYTTQSKEDFLRTSFGQPVAIETAQLLAARTFDELEAITSDMSNRMSRVLVDGLVQGKGPHEVARDLTEEVDIGRGRAERIARTEIIRAHAEGQLIALEQMGVQSVGAQVEWATAGDSLVCPKCETLEGKILPIGKAKGMLPLHPNCRCCWMPAFPDDDQNQTTGVESDDKPTRKAGTTGDQESTNVSTDLAPQQEFQVELDDEPIVPIYKPSTDEGMKPRTIPSETNPIPPRKKPRKS